MARTVDNIFTQGISGMIAGQMVFKRWNGKTFVCKSLIKVKYRTGNVFVKNVELGK